MSINLFIGWLDTPPYFQTTKSNQILIKEYPMSLIQDIISKNESLIPNFENQYKRFSYITFFPIQANASNQKDDDGKLTFWFQLISQYKSSYIGIDDNGEENSDNATIKILTIKFPMDYLKKNNLTSDKAKKFFNDVFVGKKFLTLPVSDESPVFEIKGSVRNFVKNHSQVTVDDDFDLSSFIKEFTSVKPTK